MDVRVKRTVWLLFLVFWWGALGLREDEGTTDDCKRRLESSNRDVQDLTSRLNTLKGRLEECSDKYDSLSGEYKLLEKKTAVLHASLEGKSALEAKVNRLEEALNKGLAKDSASAAKFEELEAKLASASEKVSTLETAWLPFWLQEKFDRIIALVQPAVSALVRQVGPHVRHASKAARHTWNHTVQPYVFRQFKIVMSHGAEVWGYIRSRYDAVGASIWEKMPPVVQTFAVQSRHAMLWVIRIGKPAIMKGMDDIKRNLIIALSEIEKLVVIVAKQYPATLGWASDASFGIAVFVLSFPLAAVGLPMLAGKRKSAEARSELGAKSKSTKQKKRSKRH